MSARFNMSPTKVRPFTSPEHARNGGFPTIDEVQQVAYEDPQYDKGATLASSVLRSRGESETPPTDEGSASSSITAAKSHFEGAVAQEGGAGLVFGENGRVALNQSSAHAPAQVSRRPSIFRQAGVPRIIQESPVRQPRGPPVDGSPQAFRRMSGSSQGSDPNNMKQSPTSQGSTTRGPPAFRFPVDQTKLNPTSVQRRDSTGSHMSGGSVFESPDGRQFYGPLQPIKVPSAPSGVLIGTNGQPIAQMLRDVPEVLTVHELGFRQGQRDRGEPRDSVPLSPFDPMFDNEWKTAYMLGKYSRGPAKVLPPNGEANADNFHWAPLVNVYTQNREYPNGSYDAAWTHAQCSSALDSMEARIKTILDRGQQWDRIVADVPQPMAHAISLFRDLSERYERLQREAEAAKLDHSGPRHQGRFNAHHNENPNYYNSGRTFF